MAIGGDESKILGFVQSTHPALPDTATWLFGHKSRCAFSLFRMNTSTIPSSSSLASL